MRIVVWPPANEKKSRLCAEADAELAQLKRLVRSLRLIIPASGFHMLGLTPIDSHGNLVPPLPSQPLVQQRMDDMECTVMRVNCYAALRPAARPWLKDFLKRYHRLRSDFQGLVTDVTYQMVTLLVGVGHDAARNPSFLAKYKETIGLAARIVQDALPLSDASENQAEFRKGFLETRVIEYATLRPDQWLVFDSGSLSERALVGRVARLFEINLLRWDRGHGLRLPVVRRVLEFFAYELEHPTLAALTLVVCTHLEPSRLPDAISQVMTAVIAPVAKSGEEFMNHYMEFLALERKRDERKFIRRVQEYCISLNENEQADPELTNRCREQLRLMMNASTLIAVNSEL